MDTDSLIYLIIVIAIAVINAIAQSKKKKALAAKKAAAQSAEIPDDFEPLDKLKASIKDDPLKFLFDKELFAEHVKSEEDHQPHEALSVDETLYGPSPEHDIPDYSMHHEYRDEPSHNEPTYSTGYTDYDVSKIESVLASMDSKNDLTSDYKDEEANPFQDIFQEEFDIRKAIIYSEIITPKYFPVHSKIDD